jgi:hypothetical protein
LKACSEEINELKLAEGVKQLIKDILIKDV